MIRNAPPALLLLLLLGCDGSGAVFSSRTSPDGSRIAESVLFGDYGGRLVIRSKEEGEQYVDLGESSPDLFLKWIDDHHLEVWDEEQYPKIRGVQRVGKTSIISRSYDSSRDVGGAYGRADLDVRRVAVPAGKVNADFASRARFRGHSCVLTIGAKSDPDYDAAEVEITVEVEPSHAARKPNRGASTRFTLEDGKAISQTMLTSATVSELSSYNRLPTGGRGVSVRGQFLGQSAVDLIERIEGDFVTLDFSRDFFRQVIKYELPLSEVAVPISDFRMCLAGDESLWARH